MPRRSKIKHTLFSNQCSSHRSSQLSAVSTLSSQMMGEISSLSKKLLGWMNCSNSNSVGMKITRRDNELRFWAGLRAASAFRSSFAQLTTTLQLVPLLHQPDPAAARHEWHNDHDLYYDDGCTTTNPQATTNRPRPSPAVYVGAPATPSSHEREVESEGGSCGDRPRSNVRELEEPHRGARGRRGVRRGRGTPLWCARLHICCYTPIWTIYASSVCYS